MGDTGRVAGLTAIRFPAALAVVVVHAWALLAPGSGGARLVNPLNASVTLFFILSGYVITRGCTGLPAAVFYRRRLARLGPLFLLSWVACVPLMAATGKTAEGRHAVAGLFLVDCWAPMERVGCGVVNVPAWSLSVECLFYLLFPLIGVLRVSPWLGWLLPAAAGASLWLPGLSVWAPLRLGEFALGVALARGWSPRWLPGAAAASAVGVVGYCLGAWVGWVATPNSAQSGAIALPLAVWLVKEASDRRRAPGVALGEIGYALFVTHYPVLLALQAAGAGGQAWAVAGTALAVPVAWVAHHLVERPTERRLRGGAGQPAAKWAATRAADSADG